jgi:uncharacterized protein DUF6455
MMAQLQLDPGAAARSDRGKGFARAHKTCLTCATETQCQAWLDGPRQSTNPDFCANQQFFTSVRSAQSDSDVALPLEAGARITADEQLVAGVDEPSVSDDSQCGRQNEFPIDPQRYLP